MDQGMLRLFEHMGEERLVRRMFDSVVRGVRGRGRARKWWVDGVREVLAKKDLGIQEKALFWINLACTEPSCRQWESHWLNK